MRFWKLPCGQLAAFHSVVLESSLLNFVWDSSLVLIVAIQGIYPTSSARRRRPDYETTDLQTSLLSGMTLRRLCPCNDLKKGVASLDGFSRS